jgi:hypothetical protein
MGMMKSDPVPSNDSSLQTNKSSSTLRSILSHKSRTPGKANAMKERVKEANEAEHDSESSIGMTELMESTQLEMVRDMGHYQLVDDVWHWSTVDQGRRCEYSRSCGLVT